MVAVAQSAPVVYLRELLRHGADLFAKNDDGDSALSFAHRASLTTMMRWICRGQTSQLGFPVTDVSEAGTYKRYVNEPRKQLLVLRKLSRGRATPRDGAAPRPPRASFPSPRRRMPRGSRRTACPTSCCWVLSFWRTPRDGP